MGNVQMDCGKVKMEVLWEKMRRLYQVCSTRECLVDLFAVEMEKMLILKNPLTFSAEVLIF